MGIPMKFWFVSTRSVELRITVNDEVREGEDFETLCHVERENFIFPKNLLQEMLFPCHRIVTFTFLRASPMVSFSVL